MKFAHMCTGDLDQLQVDESTMQVDDKSLL